MKHGLPRVVVAADSEALAARLETALRDIAHVRVLVGRSRMLPGVIEEHDPAAVVLASTAAGAASALHGLAGALRMPPVVLLVDDPRAAWTGAARRAGVRSVLRRDATAEELTAALTAATAGLITLHPDVFAAGVRANAAGADEDRALTPRERELLEMLAEGLSNRTIARRLGISTNTVKFHVASILAKLGVGSRTEAVTLGVRRGLIAL